MDVAAAHRRRTTLVLGALFCLIVVGGVAVGVLRQQRTDDRLAAAPPPEATASPTPAPSPTPEPRPVGARALTVQTCGNCHALAAAGMRGVVGPSLDELRPSAAAVRRAIRTGSADGIMPAGLLAGDDARRVAAYVARSARR
jgi:mono/diheme cytochrome c family protein